MGARRIGTGRINNGLAVLKLQTVKVGINAAAIQQLGMGARVFDLAPVHHHDLVGPTNGGQPVRDHKRCTPGRQPIQRVLHNLFRLRIQGRGRLVQKQDRRVAQERTGNDHPLPLAARQGRAARADRRIETPRQLGHKVRHMGCIEHVLKVGVADVGAPQQDVLPQGFVEQKRLLRHHRVKAPQVLQRHIRGRDATNAHASALWIDQPGEQVENRGLARAGRPDKRCCFTGMRHQRQIAQHLGLAIAQRHIFQRDFRGASRGRDRFGGRFQRQRRVQ
mmetsp:Transcript_18177/g.28440  ORF Transcript_18177/g.28440 Transcript_18177/m.28440 type:complete len:277 (-) Transcript_18177:1882-2712(-)